MGIFGSSEEKVEEKTIDSTGNVNNNIVIQESRDIHGMLKIDEKILYIMYIMCVVEIIKLGIYVYGSFRKTLKKKYHSKNQQNNQ